MIRADLHIHTKYSPDGELTPAEIISKCKASQLSLISITDHNTVAAITDTLALGAIHGIRVIPGIEIDCNLEGIDLHLLGYNIHWGSSDFEDLDRKISGQIMASFTQMIKNLRLLGVDVDQTEVLNKASGKLPTAELIAEVLLEKTNTPSNKLLEPYSPGGSRSDMPYINFYLDFFAQGKPAYVRVDFMKLSEAVHIIKSNGGIPIIAHPGLNLKGKEEIVEKIIQNGVLGLEVFNNYHSIEQMKYFAEIAKNRRLLMTCGSDFHGKTKPLIKPGMFNTIADYEPLVEEGLELLVS